MRVFCAGNNSHDSNSQQYVSTQMLRTTTSSAAVAAVAAAVMLTQNRADCCCKTCTVPIDISLLDTAASVTSFHTQHTTRNMQYRQTAMTLLQTALHTAVLLNAATTAVTNHWLATTQRICIDICVDV